MESQDRLRLYISGALQGARDLGAARKKYEAVAERLTRDGFAPYLPHQQTDPILARDIDAVQVFSHDLGVLSECDAVLAFLDEPSLGVGAEIALAIQRGKPVIAVCKRGNRTSRFVEGLLASSRNCTLLRYDDLEEVASSIAASLR